MINKKIQIRIINNEEFNCEIERNASNQINEYNLQLIQNLKLPQNTQLNWIDLQTNQTITELTNSENYKINCYYNIDVQYDEFSSKTIQFDIFKPLIDFIINNDFIKQYKMNFYSEEQLIKDVFQNIFQLKVNRIQCKILAQFIIKYEKKLVVFEVNPFDKMLTIKENIKNKLNIHQDFIICFNNKEINNLDSIYYQHFIPQNYTLIIKLRDTVKLEIRFLFYNLFLQINVTTKLKQLIEYLKQFYNIYDEKQIQLKCNDNNLDEEKEIQNTILKSNSVITVYMNESISLILQHKNRIHQQLKIEVEQIYQISFLNKFISCENYIITYYYKDKIINEQLTFKELQVQQDDIIQFIIKEKQQNVNYQSLSQFLKDKYLQNIDQIVIEKKDEKQETKFEKIEQDKFENIQQDKFEQIEQDKIEYISKQNMIDVDKEENNTEEIIYCIKKEEKDDFIQNISDKIEANNIEQNIQNELKDNQIQNNHEKLEYMENDLLEKNNDQQFT